MQTLADRVYSLLKKIPAGKVTTYKDIARALNTKGYQAIGQILKKNPSAPLVPCHRVVKSDGTIGGYCGKTTGKKIMLKKRLLEKEGIKFAGNKIIDFHHHFWSPKPRQPTRLPRAAS